LYRRLCDSKIENITMRFFYIKRTGRAKHGEVPYAVCAYSMEKLFQNMYLETRLR